MGKKKQRFGFVQAPPSAPVARGRHGVRFGTFNLAGEFFDPQGRRLELIDEELTLDAARERVLVGALVAYDECGCGATRGCDLTWLDESARHRLRDSGAPRVPNNAFCIPWVELWVGEGVEVVFVTATSGGATCWADRGRPYG